MNCSNIAESRGLATEVIKKQGEIINRLVIIIMMLVVLVVISISYIVYDRKLDSEFELDATEVYQDGEGYNNYIDGIGDIINGTENKENIK